MNQYTQFYINGQWSDPSQDSVHDVINPANGEVCGRVSIGNESDINNAVGAAKAAFTTYGKSSVEERIAVLERVIESYQANYNDIASAIIEEMGAPTKLAFEAQAGSGLGHLTTALKTLKNFEFSETMGDHRVVKEPIGVCGLITPWNWPINQVMCKVAPALAVGCTVVLKPSEVSPLSAYVLAKVFDEAKLPEGVFNLVNGDGSTGSILSQHPDVAQIPR